MRCFTQWRTLWMFVVLAVMGLGAMAAAPGGGEGIDSSRPEKGKEVVAYTGTAEEARGERAGSPESLSGSFVVFDPSGGGDTCWAPGSSSTLCFRAESFTGDYEYVYYIWLRFPGDWTVTGVAVSGTPACDTSGSWGNFSWSNWGGNPNEIQIDHYRGQASTDHCTATYCVTVTAGGGGGDAPVSWYWRGDGYGGPPHWPCSSDQYTPSGQSACDEWANPQASVPSCTGIGLGATPLAQRGCGGDVLSYNFTAFNSTAGAITFDITHGGNAWPVTHPGTVSVPAGGTTPFTVTHTVSSAAPDGASDTVTVTITDPGNAANTASRSVTSTKGAPGWESVPSSAPPWAGGGYPVDGCTALNGAGQWVTYILGDTTSFGGFWGFNHATGLWFDDSAAAGTPGNRWAPDWAYDPITNLCYCTGGATYPGGGNLAEAYLFDPVANAFTPLPGFTSARDFHDSWVGTIDGVKYLCIGGGANASSVLVTSTQCYDLSQTPGGAWSGENAQIPSYSSIPTPSSPYGFDSFGSADGTLYSPGADQFWTVGGGINQWATVTDEAWYFSDADNAWHSAGNTGAARFRVEGDFLDGNFYYLGGSSGGFTPTSTAVVFSGGAWSPLPDMPLARMDNIVGITPGTVWSLDGYGGSSGAYVSYYEICPPCPAITLDPAALPGGVVGAAYAQTLTAGGGTAPYTFAFTGTLPPGLTLSPDGQLSGTPTDQGSYTFTVSATDSSPLSCVGLWEYTLAIACPAITLIPPTLPEAFMGLPYSQTLAAEPPGTAYTFAVTTGDLPPGLSLAADGTLAGTPVGGGSYTFTVTATGWGTCTGSQGYTIDIACPAVTLSPASLPGGTAGVPYTQPFTADPPGGSYTFAVSAGALPPGLALSPDGTLSGTPLAAGSFPFTVTATGWGACSGSLEYSLDVACPGMAVLPPFLPGAFVGEAYAQTLTADPPGAYTFAVTGGALPPGLTLDPGGLLSGTASAAGNYGFTITATGWGICSASRNYGVTMRCPTIILSPEPATLPFGRVGSPYGFTFAAIGGTAPYGFAVILNAPPPGLALDPSGLLSGTPTTAGNYAFTVQATDAYGCKGAWNYELKIYARCGVITVNPATLPAGKVGVAYSRTVSSTGGTAPYTYAVSSGFLPPGLTLNAATGAIAGRPATPGSFPFTITATDANLCTGSRSYTIAVCSTITLSPASPLPAGKKGVAYARQITASGGIGPYAFSITAGLLPPGLTLSATGYLAGTPLYAGTYSFTVRAADSIGCAGSRTYMLTIGTQGATR